MNNRSVTQLLEAMESGESRASDELLPLVYEELHRLARLKMSREAAGNTLQPTALVHEAYLRLLGEESTSTWKNRGHFYAAAAEAMRRILIEAARRKVAEKRGGGIARVEFHEDIASATVTDNRLISLDEALTKLEVEDSECAKVVKLKYFGGLTLEEAGESLGISLRTANRHWAFARAWLKREMDRE